MLRPQLKIPTLVERQNLVKSALVCVILEIFKKNVVKTNSSIYICSEI